MSSTGINMSNTSSSPTGHDTHHELPSNVAAPLEHDQDQDMDMDVDMDSAVMNSIQASVEVPSLPYPPAAVVSVTVSVTAATSAEDDSMSLEEGEIIEDDEDEDSLEEGEIRQIPAEDHDSMSLEEGQIREDDDDAVRSSSLEEGESKSPTTCIFALPFITILLISHNRPATK